MTNFLENDQDIELSAETDVLTAPVNEGPLQENNAPGTEFVLSNELVSESKFYF
jgi:hypothetical protein